MNKKNRLLKYEIPESVEWVVGVDEVGRGSLAGPLVVAAVVFNVNHTTAARESWKGEVKDSKALRECKREILSKEIINTATKYIILETTPARIDEINIHNAVLESMNECAKSILSDGDIEINKTLVLFDGKFVPGNISYNARSVVKGDSKVFEIACASIIAKVYRDNLMKKLSECFPRYFWEENKGYGTKKHIDAILKLGLTNFHRKTFCKNFTG